MRPGRYPLQESYFWFDVLVTDPWAEQSHGLMKPVDSGVEEWKDILTLEATTHFTGRFLSCIGVFV